jgi:ketosteroid isomerase-like protein
MTADREREKRLILEVIGQERNAVEKGDIALYVATLAEDAVFMPPNAATQEGLGLRTWLAEFLERVEVAWLDLASTEVAVEGDLACHAFTYTWRVTPRTGGGSAVASGKGLHVLRRQADGAWKITREIWNATPAAAAR